MKRRCSPRSPSCARRRWPPSRQEAYPQLKADANFRDLSAKLVDTEDQLQYARRFYNGAVKQYRNRLESFPDVLVARAFGFRELPFFETDDRAAVKVQL